MLTAVLPLFPRAPKRTPLTDHADPLGRRVTAVTEHPKRTKLASLNDLNFVHTPLLSCLSKEELARTVQRARVERYAAGAELFRQGECAVDLHVLLSGSVELFSTSRGQEFGVLILSPSDIFMAAAATFDEPYVNSARVLRRSRVLHIDAIFVRELYQSSHAFSRCLTQAIAGQFRMAVRHIIDLKTRTAAQRLAAFLLRMVDSGTSGDGCPLPWTKKALALRLGIAPETLSRCLQIVATNGLHVRGKQIIVRDRKKVDAFCSYVEWLDSDEAIKGVAAR